MTFGFQDSLDCYQAIGEALAAAVKKPWTDIEVSVTLDGVQVSVMKTYQPLAGGSREDVDFIPPLGLYFHELGQLLTGSEGGKLKTCVFFMDASGKYDVTFGY